MYNFSDSDLSQLKPKYKSFKHIYIQKKKNSQTDILQTLNNLATVQEPVWKDKAVIDRQGGV